MIKLGFGALAFAALLSTSALAQQTPPPAPTAPSAPAAAKVVVPTGVFFKGQTPAQYLGRDRLIGAKVTNAQGQIIGDIEDLIVDTRTNEVQGVVMGTGGFLGAGEKKVGVRLAALRFETKDGVAVVSLPQATKEVLAALAPYQRAAPRKGIVERAKEKVQELTDKTKESAGPALEKAKEAGKAAYDKTIEVTKEAVDKAKEVTKGAVDAAKDAAKPQ